MNCRIYYNSTKHQVSKIYLINYFKGANLIKHILKLLTTSLYTFKWPLHLSCEWKSNIFRFLSVLFVLLSRIDDTVYCRSASWNRVDSWWSLSCGVLSWTTSSWLGAMYAPHLSGTTPHTTPRAASASSPWLASAWRLFVVATLVPTSTMSCILSEYLAIVAFIKGQL